MLVLTRHEKSVIAEWKKFGVLQDIEEHLLDQANGAILVTCSDADQFGEVFRHQCNLQISHRPEPRVHTFAWHGGALACAPCSPVNKRKHAHLVFLDQVSDARILKDIHVVVSRIHAPCGAARMNAVEIEEEMAIHIRAKQQIKNLNQGIVVACFFDVDYGDGKKRTLFVSREKWEMWAEQHGIPSIA